MPMLRPLCFWLLCLGFTLEVISEAASLKDIQFKADFYQRDLGQDTLRGKGNAWLKFEGRELWADEIEVDFQSKRASANGNVHLREGNIDVWCRHASTNLAGEDAILDGATLISDQLVLTGNVVRKLDAQHFEIEDGSYSHCNVQKLKDPSAAGCLDWKLAGRHFSITLESYAHIHDAVVYVRDLPIFYSPYFVAPVKTKRQSGLLMPQFTYSDGVGSGVKIPYFLVLGPWHDLTLTPTYYDKAGYQLGLNYRYAYSGDTWGEANLFFLQRRFGTDRTNPAPDDASRNRFLGLIGEGAVDIRNQIGLGGRTHTRQLIRLVSDPYYTVDYSGDIKARSDLNSYRSVLSLTSPGDNTLFTAKVEHHQSLVISEDKGVDKGSVTQLPTLSFSHTTSPLFLDWFSYEFDTSFTNFYRGGMGFDPVSTGLNKSALVHSDPDPEFHIPDYIRTGRRLKFEPRLVANIPLPRGIRLQPIATVGSMVYLFDYPTTSWVHRDYANIEIPFSFYLSRVFELGIPDYERVSHVLQPRVVYASNLYNGGTGSDHPFFFRDTTLGLSNPRFDINDQLTSFEYLRFELINRFLRKTNSGIERFFLLQLSEQFNMRTSADDPRYSKRLGPVEILSEIKLWRFTGQIQANYQLEPTLVGSEEVRENDISSSLEYRSPNSDRISVGNRIRISADPTLTEKTINLGFYKSLPIFFDLEGGFEYSYKRGELLGTRLSFLLASKPVSCWGLSISFGQDDLKRKFVRFLLRLDFGGTKGPQLG